MHVYIFNIFTYNAPQTPTLFSYTELESVPLSYYNH